MLSFLVPPGLRHGWQPTERIDYPNRVTLRDSTPWGAEAAWASGWLPVLPAGSDRHRSAPVLPSVWRVDVE